MTDPLINELNQLRRSRNAGDFLSATTLPNAQALGQSWQKAADSGLADYRKRQEPKKPISLGNGVYIGADGKSYIDDNYQSQIEAEHQRKIELQNIKDAASNKRTNILAGIPSTAGERKDMTEWATLEQTARKLQEGWSEGSVDPWQDFAINAFKQSEILQPIATMLEGAFYSPDQQQQRTQANKFEADMIRRFAGTAVTGYELGNVKSWSPFAAGLSDKESKRRLGVIIDDLNRANANRKTMASGQQIDTSVPMQTVEPESDDIQPVGRPRIINGIKMQRYSDGTVRAVE